MMELTDFGTRFQHYTELLELWESALDHVDQYKFETPITKEKWRQLVAAIETLRKQLDVLADYDGRRFYLRRAVDAAHMDTVLPGDSDVR